MLVEPCASEIILNTETETVTYSARLKSPLISPGILCRWLWAEKFHPPALDDVRSQSLLAVA